MRETLGKTEGRQSKDANGRNGDVSQAGMTKESETHGNTMEIGRNKLA